ncbi:MAG: tetratricopeptide repeat protein [Nitrospinae bacterium]|nr:tetratricopeptide repeat protein [Nitrospinota bacterium]
MKDNDIKILIVDDIFTMRRFNRNLLQTMGYTNIDEAKNGKEAIQKIDNVADLPGKEFVVCLCDWNMTPTSGLEVLKHVRGKRETKDMIFIMATAEQTQDHILTAVQAGVDNYVVKPFNQETLRDRFRATAEKFVKLGNQEFSQAKELRENGEADESVNEKLAKAHSLFLKAKNLCFWAIQPLYALAKYYAYAKKYQDAIDSLNMARKIEFGNQQVQILLAECYLKMRDYGKALAVYRTLSSLNPENIDYLQHVGELSLKLKKFPEALAALNKAASLSEKDESVGKKRLASQHKGVGEAHREIAARNKGDKESLENAEKALNKSIAFDPQLISARYNLMMAYKMAGKPELALQALKQAQEVSPQTSEDWVELGKIYIEENDAKKAAFAFSNALKGQDDETSGKLWEDIGEAYYKKGMIEEAIKSFEASIKSRPGVLRTYNLLGIVYRKKGDVVKAIESYEKGIENNPHDEGLCYNIAVALLENKEERKAKDYLLKAIKIEPDFPEAKEMLEKLR